jgi:tRNA modification GTPase
VTSTRQRDALAKVEACLSDAAGTRARGLPPDLIAVDVQAALDHLGAVTGLITSEDVLDAIFSEFCIGK